MCGLQPKLLLDCKRGWWKKSGRFKIRIMFCKRVCFYSVFRDRVVVNAQKYKMLFWFFLELKNQSGSISVVNLCLKGQSKHVEPDSYNKGTMSRNKGKLPIRLD